MPRGGLRSPAGGRPKGSREVPAPGSEERQLTRKALGEAVSVIDENLPEIMQKAVDMAKAGNENMVRYCIDRALGKPRETTRLEAGAGTGVLFQIITVRREQGEIQISDNGHLMIEGDGSGGNKD